MDLSKYEWKSDFARSYIAQGRAEGRIEVELIQQLAQKFGAVDQVVIARIRSASLHELDRWLGRVVDAGSIEEVLSR